MTLLLGGCEKQVGGVGAKVRKCQVQSGQGAKYKLLKRRESYKEQKDEKNRWGVGLMTEVIYKDGYQWRMGGGGGPPPLLFFSPHPNL